MSDAGDARAPSAGEVKNPFERIQDELAIEPVGEGLFRARLPGFEGRTFGGTTLGCAVLAAAHDCEGRALHSLHAYFLRRIPPEVPVELAVEKLSEGRRLAHRRVQLRCDGRIVCEVAASFCTPQDGVAYQDGGPTPEAPPPEALMPDEELAKIVGWEPPPPPIEWRWIEYPELLRRPDEAPLCRGWARPRRPLPDDPRVHAAALAYLSDWASQGAVQRRFSPGFAPERFVSLDHSIWVHEPARWDDWWLIDVKSPIASAGRSLSLREVYTREGRRIATIAQEALIG